MGKLKAAPAKPPPESACSTVHARRARQRLRAVGPCACYLTRDQSATSCKDAAWIRGVAVRPAAARTTPSRAPRVLKPLRHCYGSPTWPSATSRKHSHNQTLTSERGLSHGAGACVMGRPHQPFVHSGIPARSEAPCQCRHTPGELSHSRLPHPRSKPRVAAADNNAADNGWRQRLRACGPASGRRWATSPRRPRAGAGRRNNGRTPGESRPSCAALWPPTCLYYPQLLLLYACSTLSRNCRRFVHS